MIGAGGFEAHHEYPQFLGGSPGGVELVLCPNHHTRQHSLIRYLIEQTENGRAIDPRVLRRFSTAERAASQFALDSWRADGSVPHASWNIPAARTLT